MSFTREQWAYDLLAAIGNPKPNLATIDFVVGWTTAETATNSGAKFNLLNTTQPITDATDFNSVHVKNYSSYNEGIQETAITLENGRYPHILNALKTNNNIDFTGPSSAILAELRIWCGDCAYGAEFMSLGATHLNDQFLYGSAPAGENQPMPLQNYNSQSQDFNQYFTAIDGNRWQCKKTGCVIQFDIKKFFESLSIDGQTLPMIGLAITNEIYAPYKGAVAVFQFFERAVAVYNPSHNFDSQPGTEATFLAKYDDPFVAGLDPKRKAAANG